MGPKSVFLMDPATFDTLLAMREPTLTHDPTSLRFSSLYSVPVVVSPMLAHWPCPSVVDQIDPPRTRRWRRTVRRIGREVQFSI